jgi:hypothetical protein
MRSEQKTLAFKNMYSVGRMSLFTNSWNVGFIFRTAAIKAYAVTVRTLLARSNALVRFSHCFFAWLSVVFFSSGATAPSEPGPPHYRGFTITLRHTTLGRTPLDEWWARRRDLYLTTRNTHKIHAPGGIRTHKPSKRTAADPRLRPRGHWDRHLWLYGKMKFHLSYIILTVHFHSVFHKPTKCTFFDTILYSYLIPLHMFLLWSWSPLRNSGHSCKLTNFCIMQMPRRWNVSFRPVQPAFVLLTNKTLLDWCDAVRETFAQIRNVLCMSQCLKTNK